ncbi:hypothetical protein [Streptomyces gulbargensis]
MTTGRTGSGFGLSLLFDTEPLGRLINDLFHVRGTSPSLHRSSTC